MRWGFGGASVQEADGGGAAGERGDSVGVRAQALHHELRAGGDRDAAERAIVRRHQQPQHLCARGGQGAQALLHDARRTRVGGRGRAWAGVGGRGSMLALT
eukprot:6188587-Pleurochrysis_carterae.AAC.2